MKKLSAILMISLGILGVLIHDDYGISLDEAINRKNGVAAYHYVAEKTANIFHLERTYVAEVAYFKRLDRDYGVLFEVPLYVLSEKMLPGGNTASVYKRRHLITHIFFLISCVLFFRLLLWRFNSYGAALAGVLLFFVSPRIYAQSFYNSKDIIFMCSLMAGSWSLALYCRKPTWKSALLHAFCTAVSVGVRVAGIVLIGGALVAVMLRFLRNHGSRQAVMVMLGSFLVYIVASMFLVRLFWPFLWLDPFSHFAEALQNMSNFRWPGEVFYWGRFVKATELPWHYIPTWIVITTPTLILFGFALGLWSWAGCLWSQRRNITNLGDKQSVDLVLLAVFAVPFAGIILKGSVLYDGWRHVFFLYPGIIYFAVLGLHHLWLKTHLSTGRRLLLARILALLFLISGVILPFGFMVKNHPYQYAYFNPIFRSWASINFDQDYWGLSYRNAIEFILKDGSQQKIVVRGEIYDALCNNILLFPEASQARLQPVRTGPADYYITCYRYEPKLVPPGFSNNVFTAKVEENKICSVYRRERLFTANR